MKKANILKIASAFVLVAAMLIFCACGKDYSKLKLDVNSIGINLINNCSFQVTPEAVPNADAAISQLKLDETKLAKNADGSFRLFYSVSASTPEVVIVIEAVDAAAAEGISKGAVKEWIDYNAEAYASYGADQVPKLENAVNQTNGNYVFVIVSNDTPAAQSFLNAQIDAALKTA